MRLSVEETLRNLKQVEEKYKIRFIPTGEVNISEMARDCIDTIEALQQENNGWQERYYELDAGHSRLFKDFCKLQQENEQLRAQLDEWKYEVKCHMDEVIAREKQIEQLRAQVARMRGALEKAKEALAECIDALELCTHSELCKIVISPYDMINDAKQTLAAIDKAIGGKEDV